MYEATSDRGLTLVELLVVLVVVAGLAGLLLPALGSAREAARRTQCTHNQGQLARAVIAFEQRRGRYPGYQNFQGVDRFSGVDAVTGWVFPLLPHLGRHDLFSAFGPDGPPLTRGRRPRGALKLLRCTSDTLAETNVEPGVDDASSYVVNCGLRDQTSDRVNFPGDWPANGVFQSRISRPLSLADLDGDGVREFMAAASGPPWLTVDQSAARVQRGDGLSETLLLAENVDSGGWTEVEEQRVGFVWQATLDPATFTAGPGPGDFTMGQQVLLRINEAIGQVSSTGGNVDEQFRFARPASFHRGGVVVAFCDGHTRFISDETDYLVYALLMTPDGRETRQPGGARLLRMDNNPQRPGYEGRSVYALTVLGAEAY